MPKAKKEKAKQIEKAEKEKQGKMSCLKKAMLEHADPINCVMHVFAIIALVLGLWFHDWNAIIGGIAIAFAGHLQLRIRKKK